MICPICKHGEMTPGLITMTMERGEKAVVFREVPAQVCDNCGERFVDEKTTSELLRRAGEVVRTGAPVEVRSFAA